MRMLKALQLYSRRVALEQVRVSSRFRWFQRIGI